MPKIQDKRSNSFSVYLNIDHPVLVGKPALPFFLRCLELAERLTPGCRRTPHHENDRLTGWTFDLLDDGRADHLRSCHALLTRDLA